MPLPGPREENRIKLRTKAAAGDAYSQKRLRDNEARRKRRQTLRELAASATQVAEQGKKHCKDYYARQKAKRDAGDPEAIAYYEGRLQRKAERNRELKAGDRARGPDNGLGKNGAQQQPGPMAGPTHSTRNGEQQYLEEEDDDIAPLRRRGLRRGIPEVQQPDDETNGMRNHNDKRRQDMRGAGSVAREARETGRPTSGHVEEDEVRPSKRQNRHTRNSEVDDPVVKVEAQRLGVVDLTGEDEHSNVEQEELAFGWRSRSGRGGRRS